MIHHLPNLDKDKVLERILEGTIKTEDDHWLYQDCITDTGYGLLSISSKNEPIRYKVHRLSAYIYLGLDIYDGDTQVNHKNICKYKNCWNPDHIYVGTNKENGVDYRNSRTHCKNNHDLALYGVRRRRYSWDSSAIRLKCIQCDRDIRNKSKNKMRLQNKSRNEVP